jgi:hypothetical protein
MLHRIAILLVIAYVVVAGAWDAFLAAFTNDLSADSFCQAARELNQTSGGLLAVATLAIWVHVFLIWWLPRAWTGL